MLVLWRQRKARSRGQAMVGLALALTFSLWAQRLPAASSERRGDPDAPGDATTVSVSLAGIDADTFRAINGVELEKHLLVRLVQEGFAIVAPKARPDLSIIIKSVGSDIVLVEITIGLDAVVAGGGLSTDELHLAVAQQAAVLARRAERALALRPPRRDPA